MKKSYYKIFAFVLILMCACIVFTACGGKDEMDKFSISTARTAYVEAGYQVATIDKAIQDTLQYEQVSDKDTFGKDRPWVTNTNDSLKAIIDDYKANKNDTTKTKFYINKGFVAIKGNIVVVIAEYKTKKGSTEIEGTLGKITNKIFNNYYSNQPLNEIQNVYKFDPTVK